ncbi:MAG TPA: hypothetical protein VF153_07415 [Candidatus Limnocylindria bacterium]
MFNNLQLMKTRQDTAADASSSLLSGVIMEMQALELGGGQEAVLVEAGEDGSLPPAQLPLDGAQLPAADPPGRALGTNRGRRGR